VIEIETEPEPEPELIEPEPEPQIEPEPEEEPQAESEEEPEEEPEESTIVVQQKSNAHPTLMLILGILIGIVIGVAAGYYAGRLTSQIEQANAELGMNDSDEEALPMDSDFVEDAQVVEAAQPAVATEAPAEAPKAEEKTEAKATTKTAEPVYDTVTSSRYLSTIARDHYGKKSYWIFIYEANPSLGNPNSISPGTRVLVPSRESFDAGSPEATDAKAQQHLNTLSHKYKL
jgi:nucleoid-associated protein YgaU